MDTPKDWLGTLPEYLVYLAIKKLGFKEGQDFTYQDIPDFLFPLLNLGINVIGVWETINKLQETQLRSMGIKVAYISEENALSNATYYVKRALRGV